MAGAYQTASDTPVHMLKVIIFAKNKILGESLTRMMERSSIMQCAGLVNSPGEARSLISHTNIQAAFLDHPPSPEEKILSRTHGMALILLDDNTTQNQPEPGVCARLHRDLAGTTSLELILNHALEKQSLIQGLEEAHSSSNLLREDREMARRLGHIISMIGVAAHEVNQPLTSLLGHIELVNMNKDDPEKIFRYIERVDESGDKIANIVKYIQDLRHEYWMSDGAFENENRSLNIVYAGNDLPKFNHIVSILKPYKTISCTMASQNAIPLETDLILTEYSPDNDWEAWVNAGKKEEMTIALIAECGYLPAAFKVVNEFRVDAVLPAWASESQCLNTLTQACEAAYFRDKAEITQKRLRQVALKDDLTSLVTTLIIKRAIEKEIPRSEKMNRTSSLGIIYMENGDDILRTLGTKALNQAIYFLSRCLRRQSHREDLPARIQGNQFTVLLPGRDRQEAMEWCQGLVTLLSETPFDWFGKKIEIFVSAGISEHVGGKPESIEAWMERANKAIHEARVQGPGSVVVR